MSEPYLRPSRVLARLRAGQVASCVKLNLSDPRAAEIASFSGIDCVWLDTEHCPNTMEQIENQVRAVKVYSADAIVRVERGSYSDLVRPLEMDASGIMVPHVMNAEDARSIVRHTRFHPIGRRPLDGGNADAIFCAIPTGKYIEQANRERLVIAQIEDPEAMEDIDAMAQVDGIDMLFFGPGDYSHALGVAGQLAHPKVQEGYQRVAEACRKHGKFAGTVTNLERLPALIEIGYRFLSCGADVVALHDYFGRVVNAFAAAGNAQS